MEESYLPWWLIVLLGMWVASFAVWQHPRVHREIRVWSGIASWVYLLLIFVALGIGLTNSGFSFLPRDIIQGGLAICISLGLAASVWMRGRFTADSQSISYVLMTLASAGFCLSVGAMWMAAGLCLVAAIAAKPLMGELIRIWRSVSPDEGRQRWRNLVRFRPASHSSEWSDTFWLSGILNGVLACVLVGTLAYSIRVETTRINRSPRHSTLPSQEQLMRFHRRHSPLPPESPRLELSIGSRVDLIVLLSGIVFLCLSMSLDEFASLKSARPETDLSSPSV
ncbi:hypothetical protein [Schlesneria paludicola]|uniref:hypothetical protein n=1 Tax=Schlesneria paludicola TaxID=360056 RepID=UPI00029AFD7E|nr:hypothetical protein [Schlesneria paludicola]